MFETAEALGMTVAELGDRMDYAEFIEWRALAELRVAENKHRQDLAKQGMRPTARR